MDGLRFAVWPYSILAMEREKTAAKRPGHVVGWIATGVLLAALAAGAAYEGALALGVTEVGPLPGEMPPGHPLVEVAYLSLLLGGLLLMAASGFRVTADAFATPLLPLVSVAAAAFAVARYYSYDAYVAPGLLRLSYVSGVSGWWIVLLALGAGAAALVAWRRPRGGLLVQGAFLWVVAATLFVIGPWH
jgi:hypothetical protein